jgi:nucleoside-diphosphate-sugar epimerase
LSEAGVAVRLLDRVPFPGRPDAIVADLCDVAALDRAMAGGGALVHLAATPDDADFDQSLVPNNILGLERVFSAATRAGIRRWVLASSIQVNIRQSREGPWPVRISDSITPLRWYAATKVFLESAGYSHARDHGLEVIAIRLGWCPRDMAQVREIESEAIAQDTYLSPGDAGSLVLAAVTRPVPRGHHVIFGTSRPVRRWVFDPEPGRALLGWEPLDAWPVGAVSFGT